MPLPCRSLPVGVSPTSFVAMVLILSFGISCYVLKYNPVQSRHLGSRKPIQTSIKHPFSDALQNFVKSESVNPLMQNLRICFHY
ncbi:hypothetical protein XBP1_2930002 [Xenorhabdus bovienii str. puntauvense]|uniref:Uncharacterized protein n=1 Tax=Xenorhabdus bovienii str. puntauvense TaxID=1398201 RepID=A0A077NHZ7_XENBV|nr:hypothetical protein XBP1_2930002 [Xenorhabdus bovienii str. puntauvense]